MMTMKRANVVSPDLLALGAHGIVAPAGPT